MRLIFSPDAFLYGLSGLLLGVFFRTMFHIVPDIIDILFKKGNKHEKK